MRRYYFIIVFGIAILCSIQYIDYMTQKDMTSSQTLEMRRGTIVLAILSQLRSPQYGYALLQRLEHASFTIDAGTLYPLLRRLEKQSVLQSTWETSDARPRKYYRLSKEGDQFYADLKAEWQAMNKAINEMIKE